MANASLNWPLNIDFTAAVQNPHVCFKDPMLRRSQVTKNNRGRVTLWSGNFATVYKLLDKECAWAVRCFTRIPQVDVQERYAAIATHLAQHRLPYLVNFQFVDEGVLVKGDWYPILKMDWVDGVELDRYIGDRINQADSLMALERQLNQLKQDLRAAGIAHGDLQHGNIMVTPTGQLKLVDYDGMYVPALKGKPPVETGHPNYQLPERSLSDFSEAVDDFSFDVISLSLRALAQQPQLWDSFHEDNKNLIFRQDDFKQPLASPVFQSIAQINDTETQILYTQLVQRCSVDIVSSERRGELSLSERLSPWLHLSVPALPPMSRDRWVAVASILIAVGMGTALLFQYLRDHPQIAVIKRPVDAPVSQPTSNNLDSTKEALAAVPLTKAELLEQYKNGRRTFRNVNLSGLGLSGVTLTGSDLSASIFDGTDLHQANLAGANLSKASLIGADLRGIDLTKANLSDANLSGANLSEAVLSRAMLLRSNLTRAKLDFASLQGANLMKADLSEANLGAANLSATNLLLANLYRTNLIKANLQESNLSGANLSEAKLDAANLLLADLRSSELYLTGMSGTNLSSADLSSAEIMLVDLAGANLNKANFSNTNIGNIKSIESANFTSTANLSAQTQQYFCKIATGTFFNSSTNSKTSTRASLKCL